MLLCFPIFLPTTQLCLAFSSKNPGGAKSSSLGFDLDSGAARFPGVFASRCAQTRPAASTALAEIHCGQERVRNPVLPLICPHFHSDDPDTGHSWQENPPSELKLGSFCVFFLTLEASLRSILTGHPGYSHKGTVIHSSLACWGSHLCEPRLCLLLFRYFPCLCPAPHR